MSVQPGKLYIIRQPSTEAAAVGENPLKPPVAIITQKELAEILTMKEEVGMIREKIRSRERRIATSLIRGALVESGPHAVERAAGNRVTIHPFRGAILRCFILAILLVQGPPTLHHVRSIYRLAKMAPWPTIFYQKERGWECNLSGFTVLRPV